MLAGSGTEVEDVGAFGKELVGAGQGGGFVAELAAVGKRVRG